MHVYLQQMPESSDAHTLIGAQMEPRRMLGQILVSDE